VFSVSGVLGLRGVPDVPGMCGVREVRCSAGGRRTGGLPRPLVAAGDRFHAVTATPLYHVGILVEDIDAAIARFGELLGLTFGEPLDMRFDDIVEDGQRVVRDLRLVYSVEGPPFLELIEAQPDGVWGRQHGEGLHHIGVWQEGLEARVMELAASGTEPQAIVHHRGETLAVYLSPETAHGARVELVRTRQ
jgi:catechol 2,3-dioxygenase-like lactoylglutathione lyase family enzyme